MATHAEMHEAVAELQAVEQKLHKIGLHLTAKKVNAAVQKIGWEFAEQLGRVAKRENRHAD